MEGRLGANVGVVWRDIMVRMWGWRKGTSWCECGGGMERHFSVNAGVAWRASWCECRGGVEGHLGANVGVAWRGILAKMLGWRGGASVWVFFYFIRK